MDEQLTQQQMQDLWNEEAKKLEAGDPSPADELSADAPPVEETAPQDSVPQETAPQEEQPQDPLAGLPEIVKAKLAEIDQLKQSNAQLLHQFKSTEGRVAAMQREAEQARKAQQSVAPQNAPTQGQIAVAAKNPEKWEQLKSDFPEWAGAMEEYVATKLSGINLQPGIQASEVTDYVERKLAEERSAMTKAIEEARVDGRYDNWRETVNTPDFTQWFALQSAEIRALADSSSGRDAIKLLDMFHATKAKPAAEIKQERGARLAVAATTRPGQAPTAKTLDSMTPEELWQYEAVQREKTRAARGF